MASSRSDPEPPRDAAREDSAPPLPRAPSPDERRALAPAPTTPSPPARARRAGSPAPRPPVPSVPSASDDDGVADARRATPNAVVDSRGNHPGDDADDVLLDDELTRCCSADDDADASDDDADASDRFASEDDASPHVRGSLPGGGDGGFPGEPAPFAADDPRDDRNARGRGDPRAGWFRDGSGALRGVPDDLRDDEGWATGEPSREPSREILEDAASDGVDDPPRDDSAASSSASSSASASSLGAPRAAQSPTSFARSRRSSRRRRSTSSSAAAAEAAPPSVGAAPSASRSRASPRRSFASESLAGVQVRVEVANVEVDERAARTAEASDEDAEAVVAAVRRWQDPARARRTNRRASDDGSDPEAEDDDDAGFLVLDDATRGMWRRHDLVAARDEGLDERARQRGRGRGLEDRSRARGPRLDSPAALGGWASAPSASASRAASPSVDPKDLGGVGVGIGVGVGSGSLPTPPPLGREAPNAVPNAFANALPAPLAGSASPRAAAERSVSSPAATARALAPIPNAPRRRRRRTRTSRRARFPPRRGFVSTRAPGKAARATEDSYARREAVLRDPIRSRRWRADRRSTPPNRRVRRGPPGARRFSTARRTSTRRRRRPRPILCRSRPILRATNPRAARRGSSTRRVPARRRTAL